MADEQEAEIDCMLVGAEHAADRLMRSQKLQLGSPYLEGDEPPSTRQVAAVLHALADHTLIESMLHAAPGLGAYCAHLGDSWATTSGVGRYLQNMGKWREAPRKLPDWTGDRRPKAPSPIPSRGLGAILTRLLAEHWPNSGVNGHYLADLLREQSNPPGGDV